MPNEDELQLQIDTLSSEVARLTEENKQSSANIEALTTKYKEVESELEKKKEEITALKATNMALALTGQIKQSSTEDLLADVFCKKRGD